MSKLYMMNRMSGSPAAGGLLTGVAKFVGGLFKSGAAKKAAAMAVKVAKNPLAQTAAVVGASEVASGLLSGGGGRGASGGWSGRRRRGITALELRGYRKVANLIHKEGMVSRRARGKR